MSLSTAGIQLGILTLACVPGIVAAQGADDGAEATASETAIETTTDELEQCFTVPATEISVIDDRHLYVRTRGSNHYLLTMEQCDDLLLSYRRAGVRLIPFGRSICQNDGSHVVYYHGGRDSVCQIQSIDRVFNRTQANDIAKGKEPIVVLEEIVPAD